MYMIINYYPEHFPWYYAFSKSMLLNSMILSCYSNSNIFNFLTP